MQEFAAMQMLAKMLTKHSNELAVDKKSGKTKTEIKREGPL